MARFGTVGTQYFDSAGDPLASGLLYFYESGTTTAKTTYSDPTLTTANTNPVVLEADGRQPNIFFDGSAKVILTNSDFVQIEQLDPIGGDSGSQLDDWSAITVYGAGDFVIGSDGKVYKSLSAGNQNNDPTTTPGAWEQKIILGVWNSAIAYAVDTVVQGSDGLLYTSVIANTGNDPTTDDGTNWASAVASPYKVGDVVLSANASEYTAPAWLECDGSAYSAATYPDLDTELEQRYDSLTWAPAAVGAALGQYGPTIDWTSDDVYMSVSLLGSPYVANYKRTGDAFAKLANPATLPTGAGAAVAYDDTDEFLAVAHSTSPYATVYARATDTYTKLTNPGTLPTGNATGADWNPAGAHLAIQHFNSPYVSIYSKTGSGASSTLTKLANPATLPTAQGEGLAYSPDGAFLALTIVSSPYLEIYSVSGTTYTKLVAPLDVSPTGAGTFVSWDPTGTYLAIGEATAKRLIVYKRSGSSFTQLADLSPVPLTTARYASWNAAGDLMAVATLSTADPVEFYERSGDTFTKVTKFTVDTTADIVALGGGRGVRFSSDDTYLATSQVTSPYIGMTKLADVLPEIDVDDNGLVKAYINTGE